MCELINKGRFNLSRKSALITGGGGLLGPQHGIALAKRGANIVLVDIDETGLKNAKNKITDNIPEVNDSITPST